MASITEQNFEVPKKYAMYLTMWNMVAQGKNVCSLDECVEVFRSMSAMMVFPQIKAMNVGKLILAKAPPALVQGTEEQMEALANEITDNVIAQITENAKAILAGPFSIIDSDQSGYIGKKEFLGLILTANMMKKISDQSGGGGQPPGIELVQQLLDALFYIIDADDNGGISEEEIQNYLFAVSTGAAAFVVALLDVVKNSLPATAFEMMTEKAFNFIPDEQKSDGAIDYGKVAPLLEMADAQRQQVMQQQQQMVQGVMGGAVQGFMTQIQKDGLAAYEEAADQNGNMSREQFMACSSAFNKIAGEQISGNLTNLIPQEMMMMVMMMAGPIFAEAPRLIKASLNENSFPRTRTATFDLLEKDGVVAVSTLKALQNSFAPPAEGDMSAADRCKTLFSIFDANSDSAMSSVEAAAVGQKVFNYMIAAIQDSLELVSQLVADKILIGKALGMATQMAPPGFSFPVTKQMILMGFMQMGGKQDVSANAENQSLEEQCAFIFKVYDKDGDGFLNCEEISALNKDTEGTETTPEEFEMMGQMMDFDAAKGLDLETLIKGYKMGAGNVGKDYETVMKLTSA